jgi:DNA gyrase/topoisomerase IV subunit B
MENLKQFGVQEIDSKEMKTLDGGMGVGMLLVAAVGLYLAVEIAGNPSAHVEAFKRGWNAG